VHDARRELAVETADVPRKLGKPEIDEAMKLAHPIAEVLDQSIAQPHHELLAAVRAREDGRHIPAVALTAYARLEDRERALRAGFRVHVPKPVDPERLTRAVAVVLGRVSAA
jgi:CheY-like chemotaxis protein